MKFVLIDTNENFFNCGHYPEWEVRAAEGAIDPQNKTRRGTPLEYATEEEAQTVADRLNKASTDSWRAFLNA